MESDWSLLPGVGLGRLKFGMSPEAYHDFEGIYGRIEMEQGPTIPSEAQNRRWDEAVSKLTKEEANDMNKERSINNEFLAEMTTKYLDSGLSLDFHKLKLYSIMATKDNTKIHLNGLPVFLSDPEEVVLEFARSLNENPLVNGTDVVFRDSFVYLFGFTKGLNWRGKLSYYSLADANDPDADSEAQQRSLSWGTRPRNVVPEDWSQHVLVPLIQP